MTKGKIYVVGLGPGNHEHMSYKAMEVIKSVDVVVGYKTYIELIRELISDKEIVISGMKKEVDRCNQVLEIATTGKNVALVSSGDAGVYGMAGIMLEMNEDFDIEIVPGITSANASASSLGAPLMHDFCVISLSDLLTDWELIKKRIECAAIGDFVTAIYNPRSKGRQTQIVEARDIFMKHKSKDTVVGIVENAKREGENVTITTLENMLDYEINMFTTVIVGNSNTFEKEGKMVTPRGYKV